ncbi:PfkB domain-containing protein [Actinoplanes sp. SE50]|uniref:carbohydrate kinase family protein n=1 Tax=unclassified Actinoplanes TaxID=2626549 RepID=UPI00023ECE1C|nr:MULTISPECIES: carbohydrate kinase family protein [unclassified Actinoplanes]AEV82689.1 PfkB domain protein [Actinoplanes sp. SE50/110]ATO81085.1 PfkB domain-containing protein [Actinoplanes sp. SE50]SLL98492.1 PfkB domain-containing protein [Actinoplanes sp. SE50/110]
MVFLVIGGTGVDTVVPVADLPVLGADSARPRGPIEDHVSHTGTCVALALRALGGAVRVVDTVGDDELGGRVKAAFREWDIPLHAAPAPAGTRRAVNLMSPDGRRLSLYDGRDVPGYRLPAWYYDPLPAGVRHVHLTIMDWARHLIPSLRAAGVTVSTDLHDWDGENPYHRDFALGADVVFVSGVQLAAGAAERILRDGVAGRVVVTHGAGGADLYTRDGRTHRDAADPGAPVVDTNGAGDAFAAAFLTAWAAGKSDGDCLTGGTIAGAYACTRAVGAGSFISGDELELRAARPRDR